MLCIPILRAPRQIESLGAYCPQEENSQAFKMTKYLTYANLCPWHDLHQYDNLHETEFFNLRVSAEALSQNRQLNTKVIFEKKKKNCMHIFKTLSKDQIKVWFVPIGRYKILEKVQLGRGL